MVRTIERAFPNGTRVTRPAGGFVVWQEFAKLLKTSALFAEAIENGICFAPGEVFSASARYGNCLRLSCGHGWNSRIEKAVIRLGELAGAAAAGQ
jgi:DNA-binding transcriptional MocR family regulator